MLSTSFSLFLTSFVGVNVCLLIGTVLSKLSIITSYTSRKIVHISLGTCQLALWGLYPDEMSARVWGTMCCLIYVVVFLVFGLGLFQGKICDFLVATVCRNGDYKEMLYGPLNYCVTVSLLSLVFWRNYPPSVIGCGLLLWGDGMAEIIGKMIGRTEVMNPWGKKKTIEGAIAVMVCGAVGSMVMCKMIFGEYYTLYCLIFGFVGALVEFYSYPNYDNVFIPLSSVAMGYFLF
uniref:Phosphatidate cytidylyltransferase n=1 Tax=Entamoeba invadens TaxID=33085 RepID=S0B1P5_ENTIV|nr:hypothetical protein, conserved [Entamoeba invadens]